MSNNLNRDKIKSRLDEVDQIRKDKLATRQELIQRRNEITERIAELVRDDIALDDEQIWLLQVLTEDQKGE